ncbi:hypothetical protein EN871_24005 [bacterium M00.F.Ca.ET.228.01.1.1]|uniref:hypothetical protein n=1 Tax=Paraburkholderia phenoliruptrix TaxID=252970 RepID=UPI001092084D|nr:hypothetical protein [Paraburkholderia phenoliruptrix]TGP41518.1 hypothetical protein EN871_24005 [bacterium M00.F.Ca.ET.228.01.1.1]TGR98176.1 hypothetical protein EN834_23620 [bacterium M00.F.Ca.ET.191.01.1.1]TGU02367.1 hypothetical protein EN798_24440 [bacterium M00.F.Ca.ET.155.01.1.1]MBW0447170.1 hypothetical protein [Paraburkholderia phenoliruptrix]MBW9101447.1 hypothetical protein [Paraburkholderia phenoliruptrix]
MYEAMTDKLIDVLADLPAAVAQRHRHGEVRELADALDTVANTVASHSTDTASTEAQAGRVVVDGFRAAAQLCRSAIV